MSTFHYCWWEERKVLTYMIQAGENGPVKIGASVDPWQRLKELQTANGAKLELLAVLPDHNERTLHARFAAYRLQGEWFDASAPGLLELAIGTETERKEVRKLIENSLEAA